MSFTFAVAACSDPGQVVGAQWDLRSAPDGTRLVIRIGVGSGTCDSLEDVDVTEREGQVDIRARVRETDGGACTADLRVADRTVTLSEPLGDRALTGCRPSGDVAATFSTITIPSGGDCRDSFPVR